MHTVELLDEALAAARRAGYRIREEWLGGNGGGSCILHGQKWLFVDLAVDTTERLDTVARALARDPAILEVPMSGQLWNLLGARKSA